MEKINSNSYAVQPGGSQVKGKIFVLISHHIGGTKSMPDDCTSDALQGYSDKFVSIGKNDWAVF